MELSNDHRKWIKSKKMQDIPRVDKYVSDNIVLFEDSKLWLIKFLEEFNKSPDNIILCWTNKQKDEYNNYIRQILFNKKTLNRYEINEILIFSDFFQLKNKNKNSEGEIIIENINFYTSQQIKILELDIIEIELKKITITNTKKFYDDLNNLIIQNLEKINELLSKKIKVYKILISKISFDKDNNTNKYYINTLH